MCCEEHGALHWHGHSVGSLLRNLKELHFQVLDIDTKCAKSRMLIEAIRAQTLEMFVGDCVNLCPISVGPIKQHVAFGKGVLPDEVSKLGLPFQI